jgi:uncharacterized protein YbjT (DUF2867 family)
MLVGMTNETKPPSHQPTPPTVLVVGATGKVGRHAVTGLLREGVQVRALVRRPAASGLPDEVELVEGDLRRPETVAAAAAGTHATFLLWPSFDPTGAADAVAALAAATGHIVYLSAARLQGQDEGVLDGVWAEVEHLIEASGAAWTFVRAGGFAANTLSWKEEVRAGRPLRITHPRSARSLVHEHDIADVAVRALIDPGHAGRAYAVTGPEVLSQVDQTRIIGEAVGHAVIVQEKPEDEARRELEPFMGADGAAAAVAHWASLVDAPERTTDDVQRVTGRPARPYEVWVRDHVAEFSPPAAAASVGRPF